MTKRLLLFSALFSISFLASQSLRAQWVITNGWYDGFSVPNAVFHVAASGDTVFADARDNGYWLSTNAGDSWDSVSRRNATPIQGNLNVSAYAIAVIGPYCLVDWHRTSDKGKTWSTPTFDGVPDTGYNVYRLPENFTLLDGQLFAVTLTYGLYRSLDSGLTWKSTTLPKSQYGNALVCALSNHRLALLMNDTNSDISLHHFYVSPDYGLTWNRLPGSLFAGSTPYFWGITGIGNQLFAADDDGVYRSTDNGLSWECASCNTFSQSIPSLALVSVGNTLVAGIAEGAGFIPGGAVVSTDLGNSWTFLNDGFDNGFGSWSFSIEALAVGSRYIFTGNYGTGSKNSGGVWRRPLSDFGLQNVVTENSRTSDQLFRIYPNPLYQSTTISFTSATSGYADISIVNSLGTEVAHLFSGELDATEHRFTWNTDETSALRVPDGMYECLVRMNGRVETLPVVVAR